MDKFQIINQFKDLCLLEEHPFKINAYNNAIHVLISIDDLSQDFSKFHGIGSSIQKKINEIMTTGKCSKLETLKEELIQKTSDEKVLEHIKELMTIQGIGVKTAKKFISSGFHTIDKLHKASEKGLIDKKWAERISVKTQGRVDWEVANKVSEKIIQALKNGGITGRITPCGSLRRKLETVKDIDIVIEGHYNILKVMDHDLHASIFSVGDKWIRGNLDGIDFDLRMIDSESYGAMVNHLTGSKLFNIALRNLALTKGLTINEYGIFEKDTKKCLGGQNEKDLFDILGLEYIAPEMRIDSNSVKHKDI